MKIRTLLYHDDDPNFATICLANVYLRYRQKDRAEHSA